MAPRLNAAGLAGLPADIGRPRYDRARLRPGIVHLGIGAFYRAHQAPLHRRPHEQRAPRHGRAAPLLGTQLA